MFAEVLFVWGCRLFSENSCVGIILFSSPVQPQIRNETAGCCWLCHIKPTEIDQVSWDSDWLQHRKSHWDAVCAMPRKSSLLSAPFFSLAMVQLDWLHIADIGITLELLGSVFFLRYWPQATGESGCCLQGTFFFDEGLL